MFSIEGIITEIKNPKKVNEKFTVTEFIIEKDVQMKNELVTKKFCFQRNNKEVPESLLNCKVLVKFGIRTIEWKDRYITNLVAFHIELKQKIDQQKIQTSKYGMSDPDELPF